jgi:hypothetical protein
LSKECPAADGPGRQGYAKGGVQAIISDGRRAAAAGVRTPEASRTVAGGRSRSEGQGVFSDRGSGRGGNSRRLVFDTRRPPGSLPPGPRFRWSRASRATTGYHTCRHPATVPRYVNPCASTVDPGAGGARKPSSPIHSGRKSSLITKEHFKNTNSDLHPVKRHFKIRKSDLHPVKRQFKIRKSDLHPSKRHFKIRKSDLHRSKRQFKIRKSDLHPSKRQFKIRKSDLHPVKCHFKIRKSDLRPVKRHFKIGRSDLHPVKRQM